VGKVQDYAAPWWVKCDENPIRRGQLVRAFVPHVDLTPNTLVPEGRKEATDHQRATFHLEPLRAREPAKKSSLPVAALPQYDGEVYTVHRSKLRPCLIVSAGGTDVPKALRPSSSPKWQSTPTFLVAPFYGTAKTVDRAGWHPPFLDRIRRCEYPQFLLDTLPLPGTTAESVLRFDHLQPIGRHHESYEPTPFCLSDDALMLVDEWLTWLKTGELAEDAILADIRGALKHEGEPASELPATKRSDIPAPPRETP
jgi:hypothetical protein